MITCQCDRGLIHDAEIFREDIVIGHLRELGSCRFFFWICRIDTIDTCALDHHLARELERSEYWGGIGWEIWMSCSTWEKCDMCTFEGIFYFFCIKSFTDTRQVTSCVDRCFSSELFDDISEYESVHRRSEHTDFMSDSWRDTILGKFGTSTNISTTTDDSYLMNFLEVAYLFCYLFEVSKIIIIPCMIWECFSWDLYKYSHNLFIEMNWLHWREYREIILLAMTIFTFEFWWITIAPTWYGLMYAVSFLIALVLMQKQFSEKHTDTLFFATVLWVILWGRLGYVVFYNLWYFIDHPLEILMPWKGGMSFHGGAIGVIIAWYIAAQKIKKPFLTVADKLVWIVPIGLFFGRIGNYINGELMGLPGYNWPIARYINGVSYFPTPLLEALLEGWVLLSILLWKKKKIVYPGQLGVWFLGGYGLMRFFAEFFRTPDVQIGYIFGWWMTLGHTFSLGMIFTAYILSSTLRKRK